LSCSVDVGEQVGQNTAFTPYPERPLSDVWMTQSLIYGQECWFYIDAEPDKTYVVYKDSNAAVYDQLEIFGADRTTPLRTTEIGPSLYVSPSLNGLTASQRLYVRLSLIDQTKAGISYVRMESSSLEGGVLKADFGKWKVMTLDNDEEAAWACFNATAGKKYRIFFNDSELAGYRDVTVSAYTQNKTTVIPGIANSGDSFTAGSTGLVYIKGDAVQKGGYSWYYTHYFYLLVDDVEAGGEDSPVSLAENTWTDGDFTGSTDKWYCFANTPGATYYLDFRGRADSDGISAYYNAEIYNSSKGSNETYSWSDDQGTTVTASISSGDKMYVRIYKEHSLWANPQYGDAYSVR
ncbi:MAG: hypothetical protein ACRCUT_12215, partial [Spirochaetota bacterium]